MSDKLVALLDDDGLVEQLAYFSEYGTFIRDEGDWLAVTDGDEDVISGLTPVDAPLSFVPVFDDAQHTDATLVAADIT